MFLPGLVALVDSKRRRIHEDNACGLCERVREGLGPSPSWSRHAGDYTHTHKYQPCIYLYTSIYTCTVHLGCTTGDIGHQL